MISINLATVLLLQYATTINGFQSLHYGNKLFSSNVKNIVRENLSLNYASRNEGNDIEEDEFRLNMRSSGSILSESSFGGEDVPEGQRPANEYLDLVRAPLFGWAAEDKGDLGLVIRLGVVYVAFFGLISFPIAGATFTQDGYFLQKIASSNVASLMVLLVLLLRLYSGWGYIGSRLKSGFVEYEETGWYDGQVVQKSDKEKARDMFLYRTDVQPVEDRIKLVTAAVAATWLLSCVGLNYALQQKPLFNEYDPELLERLVYDEKAAGIAASQSNGRPTYCDSRYYRAVANGGQGCN